MRVIFGQPVKNGGIRDPLHSRWNEFLETYVIQKLVELLEVLGS